MDSIKQATELAKKAIVKGKVKSVKMKVKFKFKKPDEPDADDK